jgi:Protein of unknown function (DUF4238)
MNAPIDHHFIPAFFLAQWAGASGKLIEYTIKHGKLIAKRVGPRATGFEAELYSFPELPPDAAQFVEQTFFDYADRVASDALRLHLSGDTAGWTVELISAWSRFVIALHFCHPDAMSRASAYLSNCQGPPFQWMRLPSSTGRAHFRNATASPTAQCIYSSVSKASLQKMGVFLESDGDFREFSVAKVRLSVSRDIKR